MIISTDVTVIECKHCGHDHLHLTEFKCCPPMPDPSDRIPWTRFVLCPETGGRIQIKVIYEHGVYFPDVLEVMGEASH